MTRQDLPNIISILRIVLVVPIVWALLQEYFILALVLFTVAGASDALDGFLAKHFHWESRLGSILDPLADKLLLIASFASLTWIGLIPAWLFWMALGRDFLIVIGGVAYHYLLGKFDLTPVWSSKFNTALQILLVILAILEPLWSPLAGMVNIFTWMVMASILISGTEYIVVWGLRAWKQVKGIQEND